MRSIVESQALRFVASLNLLWCAQALASVSCTRSSARSGLQAIDLANARGRGSSASDPVRNGSQFRRETLQRCGREFDHNSDKPPFAAYTEVIDAIGNMFERRAPGQQEGQRAICKYRRRAVQRLFVYIGIDHGTLLTNDCVHDVIAATSRSGSPKTAIEGGAASTPRTRFRPALV